MHLRTTLRTKCCIYRICVYVFRAFSRNKYSITQYLYTLKSKLYRSLLHLILKHEYISKNICLRVKAPEDSYENRFELDAIIFELRMDISNVPMQRTRTLYNTYKLSLRDETSVRAHTKKTLQNITCIRALNT